MKAEVLLGLTCQKVQRQQVNLCSYGVLSESGNYLSENFNDDEKMKSSSNLGEYGEKGQDQEWNGSILWTVMWKELDSLTNKGINGIRINEIVYQFFKSCCCNLRMFVLKLKELNLITF